MCWILRRLIIFMATLCPVIEWVATVTGRGGFQQDQMYGSMRIGPGPSVNDNVNVN